MTRNLYTIPRTIEILCFAAGMSCAFITFPEKAGAEQPKAATEATEACLECHAEKGESITFADKTSKSVQVDRKSWLSSVHGGKLACTDCHREISGYPHRKVKFQDAREYTLDRGNTCKRCHYAQYTRALDSTHYEILKAGVREAPICVDCHGAHAIQNPRTPRLSINEKCATCHSSVTNEFKLSVHGKALLQNNPDAPACTDCHGAHAIPSPSGAEFRLNSYKLCAECHSNEERMKKYGLNTDVLVTYLDDFHGASNRLYALGAGRPEKPIATCNDCHGVHNIQSFKDRDPKMAREKVVKSCQKCHAGVTPAFADAWLSHYPPSLKTAPLVWAIKVAYTILIPLIMVGLVLHILLHLWRLRSHR